MGTNERMRRLYAHHLGREERVLASVRGTVETGRGEPWTGLLLATDRRLVFIAADEASYLPYGSIERVERGKSLLGAYVSLHTRGHVVRVKWINSRRVRPFVRAVRGAVRESRPKRRWRSTARSVS
jgi:Bacterial PH domain